jgi:hypothetical protein
MSEYQFVHFLAIDRPVAEEQLEFMERQSSRAEITPWEFTNEYHYGDFHGNAPEMLRRGYDVHLHYANFGLRRLMIRLPAGRPCERRTFAAFCPEYGLEWHADKKGKGGILEISPEGDGDSYSEQLFDVSGFLHEIAPVRELLIRGDLRPLYLAWLACAGHDDAREPPVPAGLGQLTAALEALAEFYEVDEDLIAAAAEPAPPAPSPSDADAELQQWIARQSPDDLHGLVHRLLAADPAAARAATLAQIRIETPTATWPLAKPTRTLAQLRAAAAERRQRRSQRKQTAAETARRKRLAAIAAEPRPTIAHVQQLVKQRSTDSYEQAAQELADLREALGPEQGPARARDIAEKLHRENPRLHFLTAALRKKGLLEK